MGSYSNTLNKKKVCFRIRIQIHLEYFGNA